MSRAFNPETLERYPRLDVSSSLITQRLNHWLKPINQNYYILNFKQFNR
ncbi:hypothetical protein J2T16_000726 [Paenibacillus intestini]|nr:hypothetical protein [Paenibacillus intestini]